MTKISTRDAQAIAKHLKDRTTFETHGALHGRPGAALVYGNRLPAELHDSARTAAYTVYSYATPIAWHVPGEGWVIPDRRYSVTTSHHQSKVRYAVMLAGE